MTKWEPTITACDEYLQSRTGQYEFRAVRYRAAAEFMRANGLADEDTVVDVGAGWTEFDYCLRAEYNWRGRYVPLDGWIDGSDLNHYVPSRDAEWFVALEILEHLEHPLTFTHRIQDFATKGIVFSTPNPRTTDVLGMDPTHISVINKTAMELSLGFTVTEQTFYGGVFSNGEPDSLFGTWLRQ